MTSALLAEPRGSSALVDRERQRIGALDPDDPRVVELWIAGPGALLVAKVHKIAERVGAQDRVRDKDALDVLRLLRAVETQDLGCRVATLLQSDVAAGVTRQAVDHLRTLFGGADAEGVALAGGAAAGADAAVIATSFAALVNDLLAAIEPP